MAKVIAYDNVVEGGGAMRLDDNNQPIVIETKPKTTASLFEKAMKEDEGATIEEQAEHTDWEGDIPGFEETMDDLKQIKVEFEPILPGLDPKVKSANIHLAEIKETKTTKKYTDKQMKKIVDNMKSIEKLKKNGKK
jgi:hypothetical protein